MSCVKTVLKTVISGSIPQLPAVRKITSSKNSYVQHCVKLRTKKKYRDRCQRLMLVGKDVIQEVLDSGAELHARSVFLSEGLNLELPEESMNVVFTATENVMEKLSGMTSAAGVGAVAEFEYPRIETDWQSERVLALDGVQDPGNFGTLLRTCVCFDWSPVLLLPNCCDPFNEKALKAGRGATFKVPVIMTQYEELPTLLKEKNLIPFGTDVQQEGTDLEALIKEERSPGRGVCLFLGSEGRGLSEDVRQLSLRLLRIQQSSKMESLNVAVAGGILMYRLGRSMKPTTESRSASDVRNANTEKPGTEFTVNTESL